MTATLWTTAMTTDVKMVPHVTMEKRVTHARVLMITRGSTVRLVYIKNKLKRNLNFKDLTQELAFGTVAHVSNIYLLYENMKFNNPSGINSL